MSLEICENCGRKIGALETPHLFKGHVVCEECRDRLKPTIDYATPAALSPPPPPLPPLAMQPTPYRALGLETRGAAWGIAIVGLFLSPVLVGIPLAVWGFVADSMLAKHQASAHPQYRGESRVCSVNPSGGGGSAVLAIVLIAVLLAVATYIGTEMLR